MEIPRALSHVRHSTCIHHDDHDWLEVQNRNPRKTLKFSFYGGFRSLRYVHTLENENALMRQINAFYRGVYLTSSKTKASDARFILIRNAWMYRAMESIWVSPRHAENLSYHTAGQAQIWSAQYLTQDAHRVDCERDYAWHCDSFFISWCWRLDWWLLEV